MVGTGFVNKIKCFSRFERLFSSFCKTTAKGDR